MACVSESGLGPGHTETSGEKSPEQASPLPAILERGSEPQFQALTHTYFQTRNDRQGKAGPTKVLIHLLFTP